MNWKKKTSVTLTRHLISSSVLPCFRDVMKNYYFLNNVSNGTTHSPLRVIKKYHREHFFRSVIFLSNGTRRSRSKATLTVYCHWTQQCTISCCSADLFWILDHCFLAAKKGSKALVPGTSCKDILDSGDAQGDGEYWIDPTASGDPFRVYCDMVTDGGKFKSLPSFQTGWLAFKEQGTRLTYNGAAWHKECEMSHFLASSPKAYIRHQLNIHVMVNWQLSEKSIRWPKSHDSIACSDVKFRVFS